MIKKTIPIYESNPFLEIVESSNCINFSKEFSKTVCLLTTTEVKVLMYIFKVLEQNEQEVFIDINKCLDFCGWKSSNNFYLGIRGLLEKRVLAKSIKGNTMYWINSKLFFN